VARGPCPPPSSSASAQGEQRTHGPPVHVAETQPRATDKPARLTPRQSPRSYQANAAGLRVQPCRASRAYLSSGVKAASRRACARWPCAANLDAQAPTSPPAQSPRAALRAAQLKPQAPPADKLTSRPVSNWTPLPLSCDVSNVSKTAHVRLE